MENNEIIDRLCEQNDELHEENAALKDALLVALMKLSKYQQEDLDAVDEYFAGFGGNRFN
jgi:hypothetical protein